jgi:hypothetical protein
MQRTRTAVWNVREGVSGLVPILAALALWAWVLAGVLAPLGGALARLEAGREPAVAPASCPMPPGALASAPAALDSTPCR